MGNALIDQAIEFVEKANADLEVALLDRDTTRRLLAAYARARRVVDYGIVSLSRNLDDASEVSRVTGTSMGTAKAVVHTGKVLAASGELSAALQQGDISLDQAKEIASAEESAPGAAARLVGMAQREAFHVLRYKARKAKLEAEQHKDLATRQRIARRARSYSDELGMGARPSRARAACWDADRRPGGGGGAAPRAKGQERKQTRAVRAPPRRCIRRTALRKRQGRARHPELVVLVSYEVATRGWRDVRPGEHCMIPGVGPVSPEVAKDIAKDAFLSGVFFDGTDLRNFARWSRHIPVEVALALELGDPPEFDGVLCVDCGNRFRTEFDHLDPHVAWGPASNGNLSPRCWRCHQAKTERDRTAGRLKPAEP
jgi:hypothetical protein